MKLNGPSGQTLNSHLIQGQISAGVHSDRFIGAVISNVIRAAGHEAMYHLFSPSQGGPSDTINILHKDSSFGILRVAGKQTGSQSKGKLSYKSAFVTLSPT